MPRNKNRETWKQFADYCKKHPELRFWQALRNWSGYGFVIVTDSPDVINHPEAKDTFYWSGKNAKEST
jgi:hypothetical protein